MNPSVDFYFVKAKKWQAELNLLRSIVLECAVNEELKWGCPCYTYQSANVLLIHAFKDYCALLFMKGALLNDSKGILVQQTANVQSARQMRFTNSQEIAKRRTTIKAFVKEAIEVEKKGLKVVRKETAAYTMPDEFQQYIDKMPKLKTAFLHLTPGRQRGYLLFFAAPKQSTTRVARIEKSIPAILEGKGIND